MHNTVSFNVHIDNTQVGYVQTQSKRGRFVVLTLYRSRATIVARPTVVRIHVSFSDFFSNGAVRYLRIY